MLESGLTEEQLKAILSQAGQEMVQNQIKAQAIAAQQKEEQQAALLQEQKQKEEQSEADANEAAAMNA